MKYFLFVFTFAVFVQCNLPTSKDKKASDLMPADSIPRKGADNLYQIWTIVDVDHPLPKDIYDNTDTSNIFGLPGLVFLPDSTIVENPRGQIRFGKFTVNDRNLQAFFQDGNKASYNIKLITSKKMELERHESNRMTLLTLKGDGYVYSDAMKNPFNISYNQWRIRPKNPEDEQALKQRVKEYVQFYVNFFNDNLERNATEIDFTGLPCCFNWYKGGVSVQSEKTVDKKFIRCFYSQEEGFKARQMLEDVITKDYKWVKGEPNWIKQTAPVL